MNGMPARTLRGAVTLLAALLTGLSALAQQTDATTKPTVTDAAPAESAPTAAAEAANEPLVDATAAEVLRSVCAYIATKPAFSVHGEVAFDEVFRSGAHVRRSRSLSVLLQRPNRLQIEGLSDRGRRNFYYDGKSVTVSDPDIKVYGQFDAPATVEAMLDDAIARFDVALPLADIVSDNPCAALVSDIERGYYLGEHYFDGSRFHHLFFMTAEQDLQMWIAMGDQPLLRKLLITYKDLPDNPQYGVVFSDWNFAPTIDAAKFKFTPPADTRQIEFVTRAEPEAAAAASSSTAAADAGAAQTQSPTPTQPE